MGKYCAALDKDYPSTSYAVLLATYNPTHSTLIYALTYQQLEKHKLWTNSAKNRLKKKPGDISRLLETQRLTYTFLKAFLGEYKLYTKAKISQINDNS